MLTFPGSRKPNWWQTRPARRSRRSLKFQNEKSEGDTPSLPRLEAARLDRSCSRLQAGACTRKSSTLLEAWDGASLACGGVPPGPSGPRVGYRLEVASKVEWTCKTVKEGVEKKWEP